MSPDGEIVIARLAFRSRENPGHSGEWRLTDAGELYLEMSPELAGEWRTFAETVGKTARNWGISLMVGLAAVGGVLYAQKRRPAAWALLGLSGAVGLLARQVQRGSGEWAKTAARKHPHDAVKIRSEPDGGLTFLIANRPPTPPWEMRLVPEDLNLADVQQFLAIWRQTQTGTNTNGSL